LLEFKIDADEILRMRTCSWQANVLKGTSVHMGKMSSLSGDDVVSVQD